ncbi:cardiolipin synthase [[Acholeplasma] multilocale]|uniref:cardiolipin synthase n=1 Tax=[Acholeplasma] multilocale TaxID=264638 RepID=UPI00047EDEDB|nr:cardiolipin synthase [[Acholeplasma] multilocale]
MKKNFKIFASLCFLFGIVFLTLLMSSIFISEYFAIGFIVFHLVSILFAAIVIISKNRRMETRIRWAAFIILVPIVGITCYFFFGRVYKYKTDKKYKYKNFSDFGNEAKIDMKRHVKDVLKNDIPQYRRSYIMGYNQQEDLIYDKTNVTLLDNGTDFWRSAIDEMKKAKEYILINFYIIKDGELLSNLVNVLKQKASEGVSVYIIYDFVGCYTIFKKSTKKELKKAGIKLVPFSRQILPFINWTVNYRDHRKDISIDGKVGFVGGINLGDEYINLDKHFGFWHDAHIRIEGSAVQGIEKIFASDWSFCKKQRERITDLEPSVGKLHPIRTDSDDLVQIVSSGPNHKSAMHLDVLLNLIANAQDRIWISTPYFIPPTEVIDALASAARSGIDVRLVLPGMTDKTMLLDVSKRWTRPLFEAGVRIYSINNVFNHTKSYLFDQKISFVGSTNLDFRALFSDQQTMALIKSDDFNKELEKRFEWDFSKSFEYTFLPNQELSFGKRIMVKTFNIISPLL